MADESNESSSTYGRNVLIAIFATGCVFILGLAYLVGCVDALLGST
jgi:hypothetical protein